MRLPITSTTLDKLRLRAANKKRRAQRRPRTAHIEPLEPRQLLASDFGEVGTLTLSQPNAGTWQEITLARDYVNPVVIAGPLSTGGPNPAMVRIRDVDAATDTFEVQIDEWLYQDQFHNQETFTYFAIEAGTHYLADGTQLEAGTLDVNLDTGMSDVWHSRSFNFSFSSAPLVFTQLASENGSDPAVTRQRRITSSSFEVRLREEEKRDNWHVEETVSYLAIEPGSGTPSGQQFSAGLTGDYVTHLDYPFAFDNASFADAPAFLAAMQAHDGGDTANIRYSFLSASGATVHVDEETSKDSETNHTTENVGYLAWELIGSDPRIIYGRPEVSLTANDPNASETDQDTGQFTVTRDGPTNYALDVMYTNSGTATDVDDFSSTPALTGIVTIPVGQSSATITITPVDDNDIEANETVQLTLQPASNYDIVSPAIDTITIADNDPPVDLDVDSDNNSEAGLPDHSLVEDALETVDSGKWIATHRAGDRYVPLHVALTDIGLDFANDTLTFSFDTGNEAELTIYDNDAHLSPTQIAANVGHTLTSLGFSTSTLSQTFFVSAAQIGQTAITAQLSLAASGPQGTPDTVRFTAIDDSVSCLSCLVGPATSSEGELHHGEIDAQGALERSRNRRETTEFGAMTEALLAGNAVVIQDGGQLRVYDFQHQGGGSYTLASAPRTDLPVDYDLDKSAGNYVETDGRGTVRTFDGTSSSPGGLLSVDRPGAYDETWTRNAATGLLEEVVTEVGDGSQQHVKLTRDGQDRVTQQDVILDDELVRSVSYQYYEPGEANGSPDEVKIARTYEGTYDAGTQTVTQTNILETKYYRYYAEGEADGYAGAYQYIFTDLAVQRMTGDGIAWETAADNVVAPYADEFFKYDSQGRVTARTSAASGCSACGGLGEFTYAYAVNDALPANDNLNHWRNKTVETKPDGTVETSYFNYRGQTLLTDVLAGGLNFLTYRQYDANGNVTLAAQPSAVLAYDDTANDLGVTLAAGSGLILVNEYYATTTAPEYPTDGSHPTSGGGVAGYLRRSGLKNGEGGTTIWQSERTYVQKTVSGVTNYYTYQSTAYEDDAGMQPLTMTYRYEFFPATEVSGPTVKIRQAVAPVVSAAENGSGVEEIHSVVLDVFGRVIWTQDADGFLSYTEYDEATSAVIKSIRDVDTTLTGDFDAADLPSGWTTPAAGGLHLISTREVDVLGRETKSTDPNGNIIYTVYHDDNYEVRTYVGWDTITETATLPTQVMREDRLGSYYETLVLSATPDVVAGRPTGTEAITTADIENLSRSYSNDTGQTTHVDRYFGLAGVTYGTSDNLGSEGTNFLRTLYGYDDRGRQSRVEDSTGTVQRTVYDGLSRAVSGWIGTNDTPLAGEWSPTNNDGTSNMLRTMVYEYDDSGVGDSNVTREDTIFGDGASDFYTTEHEYDFRNRRTGSKGPDGVAVDAVFDNLGKVTRQNTYADLDDDFELDAAELRARTETRFDDRQRVYQTSSYEVDQTVGTLGDRLTANTWYNHRGYQVKTQSPSGLLSKTLYDGAGRATVSLVSIDDDESAWSEALDAAGDTVIEQSQTIFDPGSRAVSGLSFRRFEGDTTTTGLLDGSNSYRDANVTWYDQANRGTHAATFGRDDGPTYYIFDATGQIIDTDGNGIPDVAEGTPRAPNTSADWIASKTEYDSAGRAYRTTDNLGRIMQTDFDVLNRTVRVIENYVDGAVTEADADTDQTVEYVYDNAGRMHILRAKNPKGTAGGVEDQETQYLFESAINGSWTTNVIYPDSADTGSTGTDQLKTTHDRLGRTITARDQRGVEHTFTYDMAGRLSADAVTALPASVDASVLRIERTYDDMSRVTAITSYDAATSGNVVNQVEYAYNDYRLVSETKQEHDGAVDASTPSVKYTYDDGASAAEARYVRLSSVEYPDGRTVHYIYPSSGIGDALSRVEAIADEASGTTRFAQYSYLGAGTIVAVSHPAVTGGLTLDYNSTGNYEGWDRFGRVVDQRWTNGTADLDRYTYTYDYNSNRTSRDNGLNSALDEDYTYDGLDRLVDTDRNGVALQSWNLDSLGNWNSFTDGGTTEDRTFNEANELETSSTRVDPRYDAAGNMISGPKPDSPADRQHYKYDAWNRLAEVSADDGIGNPGTTTAEFEYDGRNFRIQKTAGGVLEAFYYNDGQQLLETRTDGDVDPSEQYVWDLRYIDAPVVRFHDANTDGTVDDTLYYANDANMNVTALIDAATGNVVERYHYDPYGTVRIYDSNWSAQSGSAYDNVYLYTGRRLDAETGLFYYRARYYDTQLGRFISRDPIGYVDSANLYSYVNSNPTRYADPSGLEIDPDPKDYIPVIEGHPMVRNGGPGEWTRLLRVERRHFDAPFALPAYFSFWHDIEARRSYVRGKESKVMSIRLTTHARGTNGFGSNLFLMDLVTEELEQMKDKFEKESVLQFWCSCTDAGDIVVRSSLGNKGYVGEESSKYITIQHQINHSNGLEGQAEFLAAATLDTTVEPVPAAMLGYAVGYFTRAATVIGVGTGLAASVADPPDSIGVNVPEKLHDRAYRVMCVKKNSE